MKLLALLTILSTFSRAWALEVDEKILISRLQTDSPQWKQVEAQELGALDALSSLEENFETTLDANYYYSKTDEKQFSTFSPVTTPIKNKSIGLTRPTSYGVKWKLVGSQEQFTNSFVNEGTTTALTAGASIDLYKDLFGRTTRNQEELLEKNYGIAKLKKEADLKMLESSVRKIYWAWVATQQSLDITQGLLESSKKQVVEAQRRFKNNIADEGEVARYRSQVASRQAGIISLQYQEEGLKKSLRDLIPTLNDPKLTLKPVNVGKVVLEVLQCTSTIAKYSSAPLEYTPYDDIARLQKEQLLNKQKVNNAHSGLDVKLVSEYKYTGKALGADNSWDEFSNDRRKGYSVGVGISIPLEGKKSTTEDVRKAVDDKLFQAQADINASKVNSVHLQVIRTIELLSEVMKNQRENTKQLEISLKTSKKKFNQARMTVQQLVQEQDQYLQSNLDEVQTQLNVINTLLDYFSVFTQTPCGINRKVL